MRWTSPNIPHGLCGGKGKATLKKKKKKKRKKKKKKKEEKEEEEEEEPDPERQLVSLTSFKYFGMFYLTPSLP